MNTSAYRTLPDAWNALVPAFKCKRIVPLHLIVRDWSGEFGQRIGAINPKRADKRWNSYIIPEELERVRGTDRDSYALRFGVSKTGKGYRAERGDFCLVGGVVERRHLTLFYRSLEMVGGFGYDLAMLSRLETELSLQWKSLTIYACVGWVFAPQCHSSHTKERLFTQMQEIMR